MKNKKDLLKKKIYDFLIKNPDELKEIKDDFDLIIDIDDKEFLDTLCESIYELHVGYMDKLFDENDSINYIKAYRNGEYFECVKLLFYAFKYAFIEIEVKAYKTNRIKRTLLIPARTSLADLTYGILASLRAYEAHLFYIELDGFKYISNIEEINDKNHDFASKYMSLMIASFKSAKLVYDYNDNYELSIKYKGIKYIENEYFNPVIVTKAKGFGIIENDKKTLYEYFSGNSDEYDEFDNITLDEIKDDAITLYYALRGVYETEDDTKIVS